MAQPLERMTSEGEAPDATGERVIRATGAAEEARAWDPSVIQELANMAGVRAVVLTNRLGAPLLHAGHAQLASDTCEQLDLTLAALERAGQVMGADPVQVLVGIFRGATWVASVSLRCHASVLADPGANLGQLLSYMRRVFPEQKS